MNIDIICVGKIKEKYFVEGIKEYSKRLGAFVKLSVIELSDEKIPENSSQKENEAILKKEGERILKSLKPGFVVAMCVEGELYSSEEIAEKIQTASMTNSRITFIIGGSLGLFQGVKEIADVKMSFGKITLPHQLMRLVLCEQIYRAYKIINNQKYHK